LTDITKNTRNGIKQPT